MGAEAFVDFKTSQNVAVGVKAVAGGIGAHGIFVSEVPAYPNAIDCIRGRKHGIFWCIGVSDVHDPFSVNHG